MFCVNVAVTVAVPVTAHVLPESVQPVTEDSVYPDDAVNVSVTVPEAEESEHGGVLPPVPQFNTLSELVIRPLPVIEEMVMV